MKNNILTKVFPGVFIAVATMPVMTSCSDDYLDLAPITSVSAATAGESLEGAMAALNGACAYMYHQQGDMNYNDNTGENWMLNVYGEALGDKEQNGLWQNYGVTMSNWGQMRQETSTLSAFMWRYCYAHIRVCNGILDVIDNVPVSDTSEAEQRDFIKASALTLRSYAYCHLLQCYAPRWADSNNGNQVVMPLRISMNIDDMEFTTMNAIFDQLYSDLTEAVKLYAGSSYTRPGIWMPDGSVAHGVFARVAMLKNDYQTAATHAAAARDGYPIMSQSQYTDGFIKSNDEWMFGTPYMSNGIYYWNFGTDHAVNGSHYAGWGISDGIDLDLYRKIPDTDCRKQLYLTPWLIENNPELAAAYGNVTPEMFFDNSKVSQSYSVVCNSTFGQFAVHYGLKHALESVVPVYGTSDFYRAPYTGSNAPLSGKATSTWMDLNYTPSSNMVIGAQFKFYALEIYGTDQCPWMRASEMGYLEAEAQYMLGNESAARSIMNELNYGVRDDNYNCTASGAALLQEIKTYRAIELWGEGHSWFDLKRWGDPLVRNAWVEGDVNSGNWSTFYAGTTSPSDYNGWVISVPQIEFTYNKLADRSQLINGNF